MSDLFYKNLGGNDGDILLGYRNLNPIRYPILSNEFITTNNLYVCIKFF